jgi:hypothetical protein
MAGERRSTRSGKDTSTNGDKSHTDSSTSKDKAAPARSTSSKGKTAPVKKGAAAGSKDTSDDKKTTNGVKHNENGVNGTDDVEMGGEDKMTVVVPPPHSSKLSAPSGKDGEDVAMDDAENKEEAAKVPVVDPKVKAVSGL